MKRYPALPDARPVLRLHWATWGCLIISGLSMIACVVAIGLRMAGWPA